MKYFFLFPTLLMTLLFSCSSDSSKNNSHADLIIKNGVVATMNPLSPSAKVIAVKDGRISNVLIDEDISAFIGPNTNIIDAKGNFVIPGFIEGHGHFSGLGKSLINLNFLKSKNWNEIVSQVEAAAKTAKPGEWIEGRGWHQEKWNEKLEKQIHGYPYHDRLSEVSPDNPVVLYHASGHSLFANEKAMQMVGISKETPDLEGGEIVKDPNGQPIGVFEERAMTPFMDARQEYEESIPEQDKFAFWKKGIDLAEADCLKKGVTSFQDAGSTFLEIERYEKLAQEKDLDIRLWVMIRHSYDEMKGKLSRFPIIDAGNHYLTVRAVKSEVDGALGAFGAWLLKSYNDKPNFTGQNTTPIPEVKNIGTLAMENNLQFCVHAIGDRANRVVLNIFEEQFNANTDKEDLRWRIEHAQHLDQADIPRFKNLGVIASMQGIHCTSDAPFVEKRLGEERARKGAYPWRSLLDAGVVIANGTDAPVEDVDPIQSFYASVTRKRADNGFEFFEEQKMTRAEGLYSYTLGNAFAAFEEKQKGSIEVGKLADIVILSNNLLTCIDEAILDTKVLYTIVDGKIKYEL